MVREGFAVVEVVEAAPMLEVVDEAGVPPAVVMVRAWSVRDGPCVEPTGRVVVSV